MLPDNIVFTPIGVLVLSALLILGLRIWRPKFSYHWLLATSGALIAWLILILSRLTIPVSTVFPSWGAESIYRISPSLLVDQTSWAFGVVLCTLILSSLLTEAARSQEVGWLVWIGKLTLGAVGLVSVFSGNPLTLILTWGAIDLAELIILLLLVDSSRGREKVVISFSARTGGSMLLLLGFILAEVSGGMGAIDFFQISQPEAFIPTRIALILFVAAGLRLGIIPLHLPVVEEKNIRVGFGSVIRAVTAVTGLILLVRAANFGLAIDVRPVFLAMAALASIFAAVSWLVSDNGIEGRPYWILGMASIALAAAVRGQPNASLAWSIAGLLPGSLLFLNTIKHRISKIILGIGLISLTGLPIMPTWAGMELFTAPFRTPLLIFLISHSLLLFGFIKHTMNGHRPFGESQMWIKVIYFGGLGLIPFIYFGIGWLEIRELVNVAVFLSVRYWWPGLVTVLSLGSGIYLYRSYFQTVSVPEIYTQATNFFRSILSLDWFYRLLWRLYHLLGRTVRLISSILEGNGGVLWTLLLMVLLFTFLAQNSVGGN